MLYFKDYSVPLASGSSIVPRTPTGSEDEETEPFMTPRQQCNEGKNLFTIECH